jgi:two-component system phosphate regulon sensor histidine kinase PhoR
MSIRGRIFFIILSCLFIGLSLAFVVADRDLSEGLQQQIERELSKQAKILRQSFAESPKLNNSIGLKSQIDSYSDASGSRITLIARDGKVLVDSDIAMDNLESLDNHSNRPEVIAAFNNGSGSSKRFSNSTQQDMLYFALLDTSSEVERVIRISVTNAYLNSSLASLENSMTLIIVVALIVAILASVIAGNYIRESLMDLEKAASDMSHGSYEKKDLESLPIKRRDEIGSMARNISTISTNLKKQISLIAKQRDQFGSVLDGLGEGIMVCDQNGLITFRNEQIMQILGLDEIIDQSIHDIEIPALSRMYKKAQKKGKFDSEFELETGEDDTRWILAHMNKAKSTQELILVVHETTQLRQMDSMRRDFISNLSHELRTPVSVIKANSETLLDGALENKKDAKIFSKAILHNADRLSEMVSSLIDLSRIEYGDLKFVIENIVINQVIDTAIASFITKAKRKNIQLVFERQADVQVKGDAKAIERVLNNLIDNAFKYSPESSLIEVKARKSGNFMRISVLDSGDGVAEEEQKFVFKRFYRTAKARANTKQGSGLGLAIVRNLVNNLQGEVGVESRKEGGSEFWFTVPLAKSS